MKDNPLRHYSTLLGTTSTAIVITLLGYVTEWRIYLVPIYALVGALMLWLSSRFFFGFAAASAIDKAATSRGSLGTGGLTRGLRIGFGEERSEAIMDAYKKAKDGSPSDFERLAKEIDPG